jgi:membrane protease YdiL (CAAX protease family)
MPIYDYLQLRDKRLKGILVGLAVSGIYLFLALATTIGESDFIVDHSAATWINFIIGSPVAEEFLFRAVLFHELCRLIKWQWAIVISAILFVCLHLPAWLLLDNMPIELVVQSSVQIFFYGLIFAALLKATGSLWAPLSAHWLNNFVLLSLVASA